MSLPDGAGTLPVSGAPGRWSPRAASLLDACRERGLTLAVAESLTGGLVSATLVQVPGASTVLRGAVVAYATELKVSVLGVDPVHLARTGPVDATVSRQMADGVAGLLGADVGLSTTGVAGPGPADGHGAGTVHVAVVAPSGAAHRQLRLEGGRNEVRTGSVDAVLDLGLSVVLEEGPVERVDRGRRSPAP